MTREEAREYIVTHATDYLQPDRKGKGYLCPICGSGSGENGTGITTDDGIHFSCWSGAGCFTHSDIIDIIGLQYGLTEYLEKLQCAADLMNITIDDAEEHAAYTRKPAPVPVKKEAPKPEEPAPDYAQFYREANRDLDKTDYHRGLSRATLDRFLVGYVADWKHPKAPAAVPGSPRLIVPTSRSSYLARDTRANLTSKQEGFKKQKVGGVQIFNLKALENAEQPIFVVEGEIDAMSIVDVGGEAVGLGSASNVRKLLAALEKQKPAHPLVIIPDNDANGVGQKAAKKLTEGLEALQIPYKVVSLQEAIPGVKDANEALMQHREALEQFVKATREQIEADAAADLEREREAYKEESAANALQSFMQDIENSATAAFIPTGFTNVDQVLDGGFFPGLYVVGAISSLGKTTFCLQVADQVAAAGHDVLVFSLEMARNELIAKSVSRETLLLDLEQNKDTRNAKTTRGILTGSRYDGYSQKERALIRDAMKAYGEYAENIHITTGMGDIGVREIREKVEKHIHLTGKKPLVLIDYLQILAPCDPHYTDKQNTDRAVLALKIISRDYDIPVLAISSFNRESYTAPVSMASFKESGAVEYSSDVLMGLQYQGMDYEPGETEKSADRGKRIRELFKENLERGKNGEAQDIQVKFLKNRNGSKGDVKLEFFPMFNYFREPEKKKSEFTWENGND